MIPQLGRELASQGPEAKVLRMSDLGVAYVEALANKDFGRMSEILHPEVDFRGLTPNHDWQASGAREVISNVLSSWFEESDQIEETIKVETDSFADRERVAYRFRVSNPEGTFIVEQQAYLAERDGQIGWMRVLCSGFRPAPPG